MYKKKERIPAKIIIDRDFGKALFDLNRNCYLTPAEQDDLNEAEMRGEARPSYIVERSKRLTGWVGIQRYADPNDYGIDFIRNGRKILTQTSHITNTVHMRPAKGFRGNKKA